MTILRYILIGFILTTHSHSMCTLEKLSTQHSTVIFDLDGTIINTESLWHNAVKLMLTKRNVIITPEEQDQIDQKVRGLSPIGWCKIFKQMYSLDDPIESLVEDMVYFAGELFETQLSFVPGFQKCHAKINNLGMKSAIASNSPDSIILKAARVLNLDQFFGTHIYGISCVNNVAKPNPHIFLYAAAQLGSSPQECVVIEDSPTGIRAAKAAGMKCIAINTSGLPHLLIEADLIIDSYDELAMLF